MKKQLLKKIPVIVLLEVIGTTLSLGLLYLGLARTTSLEASLIVATTPLFTILGGIFFLKERQEWNEWLGLLLAFTGTILLAVLPFFQQDVTITAQNHFGNLLVFLQNVFTAVYFILAKKQYQKIPKLFVSAVSFWVGGISFFLLTLLERQWSWSTFFLTVGQELSSWSVQLAVGYMAIFASIIGLTAYIKGQDLIEASEASLFTYLQPLVAIPLAIIFLNEELHGLMVPALICIVLGIFIAEHRYRRKRLNRHSR